MSSILRAGRHLMGTEAEVLVHPGATNAVVLHPERVLDRLAELERRWSRFLPDSEVSVLNDLDGAPAVVGPDTASLLAHAALAAHRTGWSFDPLVGGDVIRLGYDRSFPWEGERGELPATPPVRARWLRIDERSGLAELPEGAQFDPGGLGKGLAADVAVGEFLAGASTGAGVLVNLGGDLRVGGVAPPTGWEVEVDHLRGPTARVALSGGALATSSVLRRRWSGDGGSELHHVVDPRTGRPADGPVVSVSVVADEGWWAEALATAVLVDWTADGPPERLLRAVAGSGVLVTLVDGSQRVCGDRGGAFTVDAGPADGTGRSGPPAPHRNGRPTSEWTTV